MLTPVALEELFEVLKTPEAGRSMIRKARKEAPVRQVRSNSSNLITRYPSQKMQRVIETESHTAEFAAMFLYECDSSILEYFAQPMEVNQALVLPSGKRDRLQHTPDFLLITPDGFMVEEWRYEARILKMALKRPDRFIRQESEWRFPQAEDYFAEWGISYRLRSAEELPRQYIQNLNFLRTYFEAGCPAPNQEEMKVLKQAFEDRPSIHLSELVGWPGLTSDTVYKAIADRIVAFDLYSDNLGETSRVQVYRDEPTMQFLRQSMAPSIGIPLERLDCKIDSGGRIVVDKQEYEILCVDEEKVTTICGGKTTEFRLDIIERLHQVGQLKIYSDNLTPLGNPVDGSRLADYSPKQLDAALTRAQWIQQAALDPHSVPKSPRTIRRYREAARLAGDSSLDKNLALVPKDHLKGRRSRRLSEKVLGLIKAAVRDQYNKPRNPSQTNVYKFFVKACDSAGESPCSFRTFAQELRDLASTRDRMGKRMAYQQARFVNYLHIREEVHGVRPFQIVHIDHTELQIELCLPNSKKSLGRPWLTLAMDAESRAVVGFYLSFDPPSYRSCMMVLRDIVRRHGRLPELLLLDNGKEFHSTSMRRLCALYGVTLRYRPAGKPRVGSVMERLFGTTQSQLINQLAGNTQMLRHARMATKSVLPEKFVAWPLPGLHAALDYYFATLYGKEPHPTHLEGPVEHLDRRLRETGERLNRLVAYDRRFLIETCPIPSDGPTRRVDRQRGVKMNHLHYDCEAFHSSKLDGVEVEVRVDPWDIRFVYVLIDNGWVRCANNQLAKYRSYTEVELRYALEEARKQKRLTKKDLSEARIFEWLLVLDPTNWDNRLKKDGQRLTETRLLYDGLHMTSVEPPVADLATTRAAPPRPTLKTAPAEAETTPLLPKHKSSTWSQKDDYELF
jgi:putative transposase